MDHNLAWFHFSENDDFDGFAYVIHWDFAMMSFIVEPAQDLFKNIIPANSWKINLDRNWVPLPSLHKMTLVNDLLHSVSTVLITFFRKLMLFY